MAETKDRITIALEEAAERIIAAVANSFSTTAVSAAGGTAAGAGQATVGAGAGTGGTTAQSGQSTQGAAGEVRVKDDVSASEVIESLNLHTLKDVGERNKSNSQFYNSLQSSNAKLFDITATALGMVTMAAQHHNSLQMQMASDHRDQNHDRQINVNETDAYSILGLATLVERLRNPTPVETKV